MSPCFAGVRESGRKLRAAGHLIGSLAPVLPGWGPGDRVTRGVPAVLPVEHHSGATPPQGNKGLVIPTVKGKGTTQDYVMGTSQPVSMKRGSLTWCSLRIRWIPARIPGHLLAATPGLRVL